MSDAKSTLAILKALFCSFFRIGAFTFGGGYAMIPLIHREVVEQHQWMDDEDMLDLLAIAESTPGVLAVNTATFVGYRQAGVIGSLTATFGVVLPSFIIISIISLFYVKFKEISWVFYAFEGIKSAVIVLMISAVLKLAKHSKPSLLNLSIIFASFVCAAFVGIDVILILVAAALIGLLTYKGIHTAKEGN
ncbi:MAG: chromate transporter [Angelakisella sp.]|nr:chromate transporter [Angelakisella sp.]